MGGQCVGGHRRREQGKGEKALCDREQGKGEKALRDREHDEA